MQSFIFSYTFICFRKTVVSSLIEEERVVGKEWPGIGGGNNTDIKHVKTTVKYQCNDVR